MKKVQKWLQQEILFFPMQATGMMRTNFSNRLTPSHLVSINADVPSMKVAIFNLIRTFLAFNECILRLCCGKGLCSTKSLVNNWCLKTKRKHFSACTLLGRLTATHCVSQAARYLNTNLLSDGQVTCNFVCDLNVANVTESFLWVKKVSALQF